MGYRMYSRICERVDGKLVNCGHVRLYPDGSLVLIFSNLAHNRSFFGKVKHDPQFIETDLMHKGNKIGYITTSEDAYGQAFISGVFNAPDKIGSIRIESN